MIVHRRLLPTPHCDLGSPQIQRVDILDTRLFNSESSKQPPGLNCYPGVQVSHHDSRRSDRTKQASFSDNTHRTTRIDGIPNMTVHNHRTFLLSPPAPPSHPAHPPLACLFLPFEPTQPRIAPSYQRPSDSRQRTNTPLVRAAEYQAPHLCWQRAQERSVRRGYPPVSSCSAGVCVMLPDLELWTKKG